jgi:xanthine dehydrogenase iron-sulfur cluster and FAD-binding subunit A
MGALGWEIHRHDKLVVVSGVGIFDIAFLKSYRQGMQAASAITYRKLFDLHQSDIRLSAEDLQRVTENARSNNAPIAGPIAVLIGREPPPLLVDMAILLKHRVGTARRFRLFKEEAEARRWLASEPLSNEGAASGLIAFDADAGSGRPRR